jgi:hypothetical protein
VKALTLHQPWASAIALGLKLVETRGWATAYRGPLAIHAGKLPSHSYEWDRLFRDLPEFRAAFERAYPQGWFSLPEMRVVAVADLAGLSRTPISADDDVLEYRLGDYSPGRWFWRLQNVGRVEGARAIPGKQGLWEIADDLVLPFIVTPKASGPGSYGDRLD